MAGIRIVRRVGGAALAAALAVGGCAAPATFVSTEPPPDVAAEARYASPLPGVRAALAASLNDAGLGLVAGRSHATRLVATRPQLPHVDSGLDQPARGALPVYVVTLLLDRSEGETHVRARLAVDHLGDRSAPYAWEYPSDLLERVFDGARRTLRERARRWSLPPRYRSAHPWRPPPAP